MAKSMAPVKVDADTDRLLSDAAHLLHMSKKDLLAEAVRDYVTARREQLHRSISETLRTLDGSDASMVGLLTGLSPQRIEELGGVSQ
ncbi:MAG: hypothetical protein ACRDPW_03550 [Mycobacteriales bacterium]